MNRPVTFLHTADWQLGMVRRFLGPDGQARFAQARLDAVAGIGRIAADTGAAFVVPAHGFAPAEMNSDAAVCRRS